MKGTDLKEDVQKNGANLHPTIKVTSVRGGSMENSKRNEIDLVENASLYANVLRLNVANYGELEILIRDIKEKEKALHEAVRNLENFQLNILFTNE